MLYVGYGIAYYSYVVGLDNRWQMFGTLARFEWNFSIKAIYANGKMRELPNPRTGERTFRDRHFFDAREGKIQLNIYGSKKWQRTYAYYLARLYPEQDGSPIKEIRYDLRQRTILEPEEARLVGTTKARQTCVSPLAIIPIELNQGTSP